MKVKRICVIGGGNMGSQITQLGALTGYEVSMRDVEDRFVQSGLGIIKGNLKKFFVDKGKMSQEEADLVIGRIRGTTDLKKAVSGAQVVIECIPEEMELKQQMFKELDEVCAPETILASNTSGLLITEIGALTKRQDKVIGMHFWNPVAVMKLVEIIRGAKTSDETYEVIKQLSASFKKEIITAKDSPNFIGGRLFSVLCNEAAKLVQEGVATVEDVDKACELGLGHAMGPFKTQDMVNGVVITVRSLNYLRSIFGDTYAPTLLQTKMVLAGETGVQAGKGFYKYK